jgi:spore maturation protein CgeB
MKRSLEKRGHLCTVDCLDAWGVQDPRDADVVIVLRGLSRYKPKSSQLNILWNISHPDKVTDDEYSEYDHVFVASSKYAADLSNRLRSPVSELLQCTDPVLFNPDVPKRERHEFLFVGNSRNIFRAIVKDAISTGLQISVFGTLWEQYLSDAHLRGQHIPNEVLAGYYAAAGVVLNDHWDTMREYGFISNRIFDALACGATVVSDRVDGLTELFGTRVLVYSSQAELKDICANPSRWGTSESRAEFANYVISEHSFDRRIQSILEVVQRLEVSRRTSATDVPTRLACID